MLKTSIFALALPAVIWAGPFGTQIDATNFAFSGPPGACGAPQCGTASFSDGFGEMLPLIAMPPLVAVGSYDDGTIVGSSSVTSTALARIGRLEGAITVLQSGQAGGAGAMALYWFDTIAVHSSVLPLGTPVDVEFRVDLSFACADGSQTGGANLHLNGSGAPLFLFDGCADASDSVTMTQSIPVGDSDARMFQVLVNLFAGSADTSNVASVLSRFHAKALHPDAFLVLSSGYVLDTPVPEPGTFVITALGIALVLAPRLFRRRMSGRRVAVVLATLAAAAATFPAQAAVIDFESLVDGDLVTTQFAGITFSGATVLTAGTTLNEFEFPPFSGVNVVVDDGGPISISFDSPMGSVGGYFTYLEPVTLEAFDAANNLVASITSAFGTNMALSGEPGSLPNEWLETVFPAGIASVVITGNAGGFSFVLDDFTYEPLGTAVVPEPGSAPILLLGLASILAGRHAARQRQSPWRTNPAQK